MADYSLAELGEISKSLAYEDVSKVKLTRWELAGRKAVGSFLQNTGKKATQRATRPVYEAAEKIKAGRDAELKASGNVFGDALGEQAGKKIKENVGRASRNAALIGGTTSVAAVAGGAGAYEWAKRREHKRTKEKMRLAAKLRSDRARAAGTR